MMTSDLVTGKLDWNTRLNPDHTLSENIEHELEAAEGSKGPKKSLDISGLKRTDKNTAKDLNAIISSMQSDASIPDLSITGEGTKVKASKQRKKKFEEPEYQAELPYTISAKGYRRSKFKLANRDTPAYKFDEATTQMGYEVTKAAQREGKKYEKELESLGMKPASSTRAKSATKRVTRR